MEVRKVVAAATLAAIPTVSVATLNQTVQPAAAKTADSAHMKWGDALGLPGWQVTLMQASCFIVTEGIGVLACGFVGAC